MWHASFSLLYVCACAFILCINVCIYIPFLLWWLKSPFSARWFNDCHCSCFFLLKTPIAKNLVNHMLFGCWSMREQLCCCKTIKFPMVTWWEFLLCHLFDVISGPNLDKIMIKRGNFTKLPILNLYKTICHFHLQCIMAFLLALAVGCGCSRLWLLMDKNDLWNHYCPPYWRLRLLLFFASHKPSWQMLLPLAWVVQNLYKADIGGGCESNNCCYHCLSAVSNICRLAVATRC